MRVVQTRRMAQRDELIERFLKRIVDERAVQVARTEPSHSFARIYTEQFERNMPRARGFLARQSTSTLEALARDLDRPDPLVGMRGGWDSLLSLLTSAAGDVRRDPSRASDLEDLLTFREVFVRRHMLTSYKISIADFAHALHLAADQSLTDFARLAGHDAVADVLDIDCVNGRFQSEEAHSRATETGYSSVEEWGYLTQGYRSMTLTFATWILESRPSRTEVADALFAGPPASRGVNPTRNEGRVTGLDHAKWRAALLDI